MKSFKLLPFSFKIVACGPSSESERRPRPDIIEDDDISDDDYAEYIGTSSESERRPRPDIIEDDDIPDDEYARPDIIEDNDIPDDEYEEYLDSPGSIQPQIRGNAVFPSITEVGLK